MDRFGSTFAPSVLRGALAVLAFGYRAVEIWREEFPRDWEAVKKKAQARKKEKEAEEKSAKNRKA